MTSVIENVWPTVEELEESIKGRRRGQKVFGGEVNRRFFCPIPMCREDKRWFKSQKTLNQHYSKVHAERAFECQLCQRQFSLERDMKYHLKKQHAQETPPEKPHAQRIKTWSCRSCPVTFNRKYDLNDHVRNEHESHDKRFECILCECSFETDDAVENHFRQQHSDLIDFQVDSNAESTKEHNTDGALQTIMDKYLPIQPKPSPGPPAQNEFVDCSFQQEEIDEMQCYEMQLMPEQWSDGSYASTQTEYCNAEVTSSYAQTEWPNRAEYQLPVLSYSYEYSTEYMERQDFGAQTYYAETQDFGTQVDSQSPMQNLSWAPMTMGYEDDGNYGHDGSLQMMDSDMCHVGTTSYYSDWTRHTETQTDTYYYPYSTTEEEPIATTFTNGSTQTNEVTYDSRMV